MWGQPARTRVWLVSAVFESIFCTGVRLLPVSRSAAALSTSLLCLTVAGVVLRHPSGTQRPWLCGRQGGGGDGWRAQQTINGERVLGLGDLGAGGT